MTLSRSARLAPLLSILAMAACGESGESGTAATTAADTPAAEASSAQQSADAQPAEPEMIAAPPGSKAADEMAIGDPDAPLTITEFASVTCPGCAAFHSSAFPAIKEELIETGQVRFIYKEFPTPPVRYSQAGFILARCAATEAGSDAYFAMVDALYKTQRNWVYGNDTAGALRNIAAQAGITGEDFDRCFRREDIRDAIIASVEEGRDLGLTGTPSFVVDGEELQLRGTPDEIVETIRAETEKRS
mgnify:FL=1